MFLQGWRTRGASRPWPLLQSCVFILIFDSKPVDARRGWWDSWFSSESETNYALVARRARHLSAIILANTDSRTIDFCISVVTWLIKQHFFLRSE